MAKPTRSDNWGFPRWRPYGATGQAAVRIRLCDREGCNAAGDRPAPKAPNKPDRWMFCEAHAAEYNKGWNYFAGLSPEEAARRAAEEEGENSAFRTAAQYQW
nr:molecular chaperone DnaJ [Sphingomonas sp.]